MFRPEHKHVVNRVRVPRDFHDSLNTLFTVELLHGPSDKPGVQPARVEWAARLVSGDRAIIAYTASRDADFSSPRPALRSIYWRDIHNNIFFVGFADTPDEVTAALGAAARVALEYGGWLHMLASERRLSPYDWPFLFVTQRTHGHGVQRDTVHPDVIPIGASQHLISVVALSMIFMVSEKKARDWLDKLGVRRLSCPNGKEYFSLWELELKLLMRSFDIDAEAAARMIEKARTVYDAAKRSRAIERLRSLARELKPRARLLRPRSHLSRKLVQRDSDGRKLFDPPVSQFKPQAQRGFMRQWLTDTLFKTDAAAGKRSSTLSTGSASAPSENHDAPETSTPETPQSPPGSPVSENQAGKNTTKENGK